MPKSEKPDLTHVDDEDLIDELRSRGMLLTVMKSEDISGRLDENDQVPDLDEDALDELTAFAMNLIESSYEERMDTLGNEVLDQFMADEQSQIIVEANKLRSGMASVRVKQT